MSRSNQIALAAVFGASVLMSGLSGYAVGYSATPIVISTEPRVVERVVSAYPGSCWIRPLKDGVDIGDLEIHNTGICIGAGIKNVSIHGNSITNGDVAPGPVDCPK